MAIDKYSRGYKLSLNPKVWFYRLSDVFFKPRASYLFRKVSSVRTRFLESTNRSMPDGQR